jgi:hypothetical protein
MKRIAAPRMFVTLFVAVLTTTTAWAHNGGCSAASVAGKWTFTTTGSIPGIGPVAAVGSYVADSSGNLKGSQTRSLNGDVADETFTGTSTVNSDCTGTDVIQVFLSGVLVRTSTLQVVYDDDGPKARAIFTSLVLPDGTNLPTILTIDAKRVTPSGDGH